MQFLDDSPRSWETRAPNPKAARTEIKDINKKQVKESSKISMADHDPKPKRRQHCTNCDRPSAVCICSVLPGPGELKPTTKILVLQHPHQRRQKLCTVPILEKCLPNATHVAVGRNLQAAATFFTEIQPATILLLFPSEESMNLECLKGSFWDKKIVLVAVDGTWEHAREMMKASKGFIEALELQAEVKQVCLSTYPNSQGLWMGNSELILRKEPCLGCVSTMEAVARALGILEPHGGMLCDRLLGVLRTVVGFQSQHLRPGLKPRPKVPSKKKQQKEQQQEEDENRPSPGQDSVVAG